MANGDGLRPSWAANMLVVTRVQLQLGGFIAAPNSNRRDRLLLTPGNLVRNQVTATIDAE